jgi:hypothetical protein
MMRLGLASIAAAVVISSAAIGGSAAAQSGFSSPFDTPQGSWSRSCMGGMVMSGELIANCQDSRGFYRQARINVASCRGAEIINDNGNLVCYPREERRGAWGGGGWGGRARITVYEHVNYQGQARTFEGEVPNMVPLRFNDVVSSMQMRGAWEVCTDVDYRGRCEIFDRDVPNVVPLGLNDLISSMRPAGRR